MANELAILQKDISDKITLKLQTMQSDEGLALPKNYNPASALKSAFFAITNSNSGNLLEKCTQDSVANALLDMAIQGLNPAKTQCYFIPYGNKLTMTRSYFGTQTVLKQKKEVKDVWATVVYEGDEFEIDVVHGRTEILVHRTKFLNRDNPIVGVYCTILKANGEEVTTVMTKKEIETSWSQAKNKSVQQKFPQEMAKRTVINRAAKEFINTSDDSDLLSEAYTRTTENEYDYTDVDAPSESPKAQNIADRFKRQRKDVTPVEEATPVNRPAPKSEPEAKPKPATKKAKPAPEPEPVVEPEPIAEPEQADLGLVMPGADKRDDFTRDDSDPGEDDFDDTIYPF